MTMQMPEITPARFADTWLEFSGTEPQGYREHFNQLCRLVGHDTPIEHGDFSTFAFEKSAPTLGDRYGFADVWLSDRFVMEYKGKGENLDDAYMQVLRYRDGLGNPPLLITCDFNRIRIHTNFTGTVSETYTITISDLRSPTDWARRKDATGKEGAGSLSVMETLSACFHDPSRLKPTLSPEDLTTRAADEFKVVADRLQEWNPNQHVEIARFLSRLLFCMFACDTGLLDKDIVNRITQDLGNAPSKEFTRRLNELFVTMSAGGQTGWFQVKRFNGGLFNGERDELDVGSIVNDVRRADRLDWSQVEPSVFGTLFERVFNPSKRAQLGKHYTSREDILTLIEPVIMTPVHRKWKRVKAKIGNDKREKARHSYSDS